MSNGSNTYQIGGEALLEREEPQPTPLSLADYCYGLVNFELPEEALRTIMAKRDLDGSVAYSEVEKRDRELIEADIYVWICTGASRTTSTTDTDNGWTHSGGGFTLTEADKRFLLRKANVIYEEYGEPVAAKSKIRIQSHGIKPSNRTMSGERLKHTIR